MNITSRKSILLVVFAVLFASGAGMAAVTIDTETTNTASTSDLQDGDTVTDIHNDSVESTVEVQSDNASSGDDFAVYFTVNDSASPQDGEQFYTTDESWTATDSTNGHYELNLTHGEVFEALEIGASETVTVDMQVVVNESESSEESTTIQLNAQNDVSDAVLTIDGNEDSTSVADSTGAFSFSSFNPLSNDSDAAGAVTSSDDSVFVNATNTTEVRVVANNQSTADAMSAVADSAESGSFVPTATVTVADTRVPVFYESADASWLDTSSDAYATLSSDGDTITVHNADTLVDEDGNVTAEATVNDAVGFGETRNMLSNYDTTQVERLMIAADAANFNGSPFEEDS